MGFIYFNIYSNPATDFEYTINDLPDLAETAYNDVTGIFEDYTLRYTPIGETGQLYSQTFIDVDGFLNSTIWSPVDQWDYVIMGTKPHDIFGNWYLWWPGALHPVHHVKHPGTIANDYPALAYMDGMGEAETRLDTFLDEIIGD